MNPEILKDLAIGVTGSLIGAAIVYFTSVGVKLQRQSKEESKKIYENEIVLWKSRKIGIRQAISNAYLFDVLKNFLFANLVTIVPGIGTYIIVAFSEPGILEKLYLVFAGISLVSLYFYLVAFGKAVRYLKIRKSDDDYLSSLAEQMKTEPVEITNT